MFKRWHMQACEVVDKCLQELLTAVDTANGRWLITSDHGNADDMVQRDKKGKPLTDSDGKPIPLTSHTLSPVGVAIGGKGLPEKVKVCGILSCAFNSQRWVSSLMPAMAIWSIVITRVSPSKTRMVG